MKQVVSLWLEWQDQIEGGHSVTVGKARIDHSGLQAEGSRWGKTTGETHSWSHRRQGSRRPPRSLEAQWTPCQERPGIQEGESQFLFLVGTKGSAAGGRGEDISTIRNYRARIWGPQALQRPKEWSQI